MKQSRRSFLKTTASATAISVLSSFDTTTKSAAADGYRLMIMATDWGFKGSRDEFCAAAKKEGYDGIEVWWPGQEPRAQEELFTAVKKHGLQLGFLCGGWQADHAEHIKTFKTSLDEVLANKFQRPAYVNCHSGKDYFSYEQNKPFIDHSTAKTKETGIPVYHETHRGRMLFAANIARQFIEKNPDLRLTFDVSHWCNVHESLLADQQETLELALQRVEHIHARVGHAEGPQVNDPRAPEWENALKAHLAWWDKVAERKRKTGGVLSFLTEFGPPDYLPTLPYTRQPLADQWAINVHMMQLLRKRYA
jgi:sugar phosphate isomerase/epimerase